ncbi:hypothetical protein BBJ28_00023030 [Nothophytophthora sp. Chile5]|nr:hypothetical protein BBJ28_00023030 [Nothophytophthora sp. Chile5]
MKVYGMMRAAMMAAAMVSLASAGKTCDMDPTPAATTTTTAVTAAPTEAPVTVETAAPAAVTEAPTDAPATQGDVSGEAETDAPAVETEAPATDGSTTTTTSSGAAQSTAGTVATQISYVGADCGGAGFSYDMVTDVATCAKTSVTTSSSVSPFDDDVTLSFRGPMTIHNIAVFDGSQGSWEKVSSYENGGAATNMVFMNNHNIDYAGTSSPEGFATEDGTGTATASTPFSGTLAAASNPYGQSIYAEDSTGAEVHIMTEKKCGVDVECVGAYDSDGTAFQGWSGTKKIFVTKVTMPEGGAPNVPAVWMLNAQIVRSGQYQCNCRGTGSAGGCGELDIAEVLEKDTSYVATHYYFYDGSVAPGNDQFGARPTDGPATYVTIIDEAYGVKIVQLGADDFDFGCGSITDDVVSQWENAA